MKIMKKEGLSGIRVLAVMLSLLCVIMAVSGLSVLASGDEAVNGGESVTLGDTLKEGETLDLSTGEGLPEKTEKDSSKEKTESSSEAEVSGNSPVLKKNVSDLVEVKLHSFYLEAASNYGVDYERFDFITDGEIVHSGLKAEGGLKIVSGRSTGLLYTFAISDDNMAQLEEGAYFEFAVPGKKALLKSDEENRPMSISVQKESGEVEVGEFALYSILTDSTDNTRKVRIHFTKDFRAYKGIRDGKFQMRATLASHMQEIALAGGNEITFTPVISGHFTPLRNQSPFYKWGFNEGAVVSEKTLPYEFHINRDQLLKVYNGEKITERRDVFVVDELPKGLEIDTESIYAALPLHPPALNEDNQVTNEPAVSHYVKAFWNYQNKDGEKIWLGNSYDKTLLKKDIYEGEDDFETYKQKIIASKIPTIGVHHKTKMVVYLGDLPGTYSYEEAFVNKEKSLSDFIMAENTKDYEMTDEQKAAMRNAYVGEDKKVFYYVVGFKANIKELPSDGIFTNHADLFWYEGDGSGEPKINKVSANLSNKVDHASGSFSAGFGSGAGSSGGDAATPDGGTGTPGDTSTPDANSGDTPGGNTGTPSGSESNTSGNTPTYPGYIVPVAPIFPEISLPAVSQSSSTDSYPQVTPAPEPEEEKLDVDADEVPRGNADIEEDEENFTVEEGDASDLEILEDGVPRGKTDLKKKGVLAQTGGLRSYFGEILAVFSFLVLLSIFFGMRKRKTK